MGSRIMPGGSRRDGVKWSELVVPAILVGAWILLQLVILPRLGVST
jgi:hypothetical protein